jgi:DNA-binding response OmpR family regulator
MSKVLLIEDDKDLNDAYNMILKKASYEVETTFNGEEGLEKLKSFNPDIILLDLIMPVKSGNDFLEEYYRTPSASSPKIVIITNLEHSEEITKALALGAFKCVVKSKTTPQGLLKIVQTTLKS